MPKAIVCSRCERTFYRPRAYRGHLEMNRCSGSVLDVALSLHDPPPNVNPESPPSDSTRGEPTLPVTPEDQFVLKLCAPSSSLTESPLTPAALGVHAATENSADERPTVPPRSKPASASLAVQADGD